MKQFPGFDDPDTFTTLSLDHKWEYIHNILVGKEWEKYYNKESQSYLDISFTTKEIEEEEEEKDRLGYYPCIKFKDIEIFHDSDKHDTFFVYNNNEDITEETDLDELFTQIRNYLIKENKEDPRKTQSVINDLSKGLNSIISKDQVQKQLQALVKRGNNHLDQISPEELTKFSERIQCDLCQELYALCEGTPVLKHYGNTAKIKRLIMLFSEENKTFHDLIGRHSDFIKCYFEYYHKEPIFQDIKKFSQIFLTIQRGKLSLANFKKYLFLFQMQNRKNRQIRYDLTNYTLDSLYFPPQLIQGDVSELPGGEKCFLQQG